MNFAFIEKLDYTFCWIARDICDCYIANSINRRYARRCHRCWICECTPVALSVPHVPVFCNVPERQDRARAPPARIVRNGKRSSYFRMTNILKMGQPLRQAAASIEAKREADLYALKREGGKFGTQTRWGGWMVLQKVLNFNTSNAFVCLHDDKNMVRQSH